MVLGAILGAVIAIPAFVLFLRTEAGGYLLQTYVMTLPQWPNVNTEELDLPANSGTPVSGATTTPGMATAAATTTSQGIAVPKAYANAQYYTSINALSQSVRDFGTSYAKLVPVLTTINANSLSHNYNGFFDLIVQAKALLADEKVYVSNISRNLNALSMANLQTTDAQTKTMTNALIDTGNAYYTALATYTASLDKLLSGAAPTADDLIAINTQANAVKNAAAAFDAKAQILFEHFAAAIRTAQSAR